MTRCPAPRRTRRATPFPRRSGALTLLAATTLAACDIPTALPRIETRFVVPGESTTVGVDEMLPTGVRRVGADFQVDIAPRAVPRTTLRELCSACQAVDGQLVPKPGFTASIPVALQLPASVDRVALTGGSIVVSLTHAFGFDPLQPRGRSTDGSITITLSSAGEAIGSTSLTGPFPSGTTRVATLELEPGEVTGDLSVEIVISSPAGGTAPADWVVIDADAALTGEVRPGVIRVAEARFAVQNRTISAATAEIDLSDIDETMQENIVRGAIVLEMQNPFEVTGNLQLTLRAGSTTITKPVGIQPGQTTQRVEFSGAELRTLLGSNVIMTLQGTVGSGSLITVRPGDEITVSTMLDLTFELGAGD